MLMVRSCLDEGLDLILFVKISPVENQKSRLAYLCEYLFLGKLLKLWNSLLHIKTSFITGSRHLAIHARVYRL